jgi:hypothetical protein
LASLDSLKRYLNKDDSQEDGILQLVLEGVSNRIEDWIGQPVEVVEYTDEAHISGDYAELTLYHGPIVEVTAVSENGTALATADWREDQAAHTLTRLSDDSRPKRWQGEVLVTYKAGFEIVPKALELATVTQAAFEYQQTKSGDGRLGLVSHSPESGDGVGYAPHEFLGSVTEAMNRYRGLI